MSANHVSELMVMPMPPPRPASGAGNGAPQSARSAADEDDEEHDWKYYLKIVLPHVGLAMICVLYILAGASAFFFIERPHEHELRQIALDDILEAREVFLDELWLLSDRAFHDNISQELWMHVADVHLRNISRVLFNWYSVTSDDVPPRTNDSDSIELGNNWSFPASIFFAASTVTTIGYGNITPVTYKGRIFCVFFGLFGVPLMLVTIADLGKFIGDAITFVYEKYRSLKRRLRARMCPNMSATTTGAGQSEAQNDFFEEFGMEADMLNNSVPASWIVVIIVGYTALGGYLMPLTEHEWSFGEAFYFSFITMTTVGFGDFVPTKEQYYWLTLPYILMGLAIATMCVDLVGSQYIVKMHAMGRKFQDMQSQLRTIGDMMAYQRMLKNKYGFTEEELANMPLETLLALRNAYRPKNLESIYYIDQRTNTSMMSLGSGPDSARGRAPPPPPVPNNNDMLRRESRAYLTEDDRMSMLSVDRV